MLKLLRDHFSPQERRVIGAEAQQALENKHWKEAFFAVDEYLDRVALSCDPDNKEKAQRVIISKQLLASIKQELIRKIEDGEFAKVEIEQIEQAKAPSKFLR